MNLEEITKGRTAQELEQEIAMLNSAHATYEAVLEAQRLGMPIGSSNDCYVELIDFNALQQKNKFFDLQDAHIKVLGLVELLENNAFLDPLTGIGNRRLYDLNITKMLSDARPSKERPKGKNLAMYFLDVDNFKKVNDSYGHSSGDQLLRGIARSMSDVARADDFVGRIGGEEFVVLCYVDEKDPRSSAFAFGERLRDTIARQNYSFNGVSYSPTVSIGIAVFDPSRDGASEVNEEKMFLRSDRAMYASKMSGKNRTTVYEK